VKYTVPRCRGGRAWRFRVVFVPTLAALFGVSTDMLLGVGDAHARTRTSKHGPTTKLQLQRECLRRLPKAQQHIVLAMLDGVLLHHG